MRHFRLSLFLLLALLQCLAPLLHGHLSASDSDGVHLHLGVFHHMGNDHGPGAMLDTHDDHGAAMGVASPYKRDVVLSQVWAALSLLLIVLAVSPIAWPPRHASPRGAYLAPHVRPLATAPPRHTS